MAGVSVQEIEQMTNISQFEGNAQSYVYRMTKRADFDKLLSNSTERGEAGGKEMYRYKKRPYGNAGFCDFG